MKYHIPTTIRTSETYPLSTQYSTCANCGLEIERWELEDDDMGIFWTKWGIRKGGTLLGEKTCGVSS